MKFTKTNIKNLKTQACFLVAKIEKSIEIEKKVKNRKKKAWFLPNKTGKSVEIQKSQKSKKNWEP